MFSFTLKGLRLGTPKVESQESRGSCPDPWIGQWTSREKRKEGLLLFFFVVPLTVIND